MLRVSAVLKLSINNQNVKAHQQNYLRLFIFKIVSIHDSRNLQTSH